MILLLPHASDGVTAFGLESVRSLQGQWTAACQQPACYVPTVWGQAANKTFSQALILMHTVFLLSVWLTLSCVLF